MFYFNLKIVRFFCWTLYMQTDGWTDTIKLTGTSRDYSNVPKKGPYSWQMWTF
jgi:hypothetical protein